MKNYCAGGKTPTWPELATATLEGPEEIGGALRYTFNRAIGSKG
jgi:PRTRC genetic system protein C